MMQGEGGEDLLAFAEARTAGGMTLSGPNAWRGSMKAARIFPHFLHSATREEKLSVKLIRFAGCLSAVSQRRGSCSATPDGRHERGTSAGEVGQVGRLTRHGRREWVVEPHRCDAGIEARGEEDRGEKGREGSRGRRVGRGEGRKSYESQQDAAVCMFVLCMSGKLV
jgi:hypothetical protein